MVLSEAPMVFSRVYLPRPLAAIQVHGLLRRLAADHAGPRLVFEARKGSGGIRHLLAAPIGSTDGLRRTLDDLLPGTWLDGPGSGQRGGVQEVRRLRLRPGSLALTDDRAEAVSTALLSALAAGSEPGETLVVQVMLGRRIAPQHVPAETPNPTQAWWQLLTQGQLAAPRPVRDQIQARSGQHGFAATIRVGVSAATPGRRRWLLDGVLAALSMAQSRGVSLDLVEDRPAALELGAAPWRWPLHLGVSELVGLLAWPLGEGELPGLPPLHPKLLRVATGITAVERIFATSGAPGPARAVGVSAADSLGHLVALGPSGAGKSNALLHFIKADSDAGRPLLVIDAKKQLIDDVLDRAISVGRIHDVVILDPADTDVTVGFNPLDVAGRDPDVVVDGLLAVVAAVFRDGWGPRTQDIIHSCLATLARASRHHTQTHTPHTQNQPAAFTLLDLPRLLTDDAFRAGVIGCVADDPGLGSFWAWYNDLSAPARAQVIAAPLNKIRQYLLRPSLRRILGQPRPSFALRNIFRENKIVLVPLNEALIGPITAQLLGSLVVAEAWSATLERAAETNPAARPGMVYVDEVQKFLHLPTPIGDALAQSRSLGVAWHLAHQFRGQLPAEMRAAVDSNARNKLIFRPNDPDDARDMARQAPDLDAVDFMSLRPFEAYARLSVDGAPVDWCSVRTLPPPPLTGLGAQIRAASRATYGPTPATPDSTDSAGGLDDDYPVGRKRRTP